MTKTSRPESRSSAAPSFALKAFPLEVKDATPTGHVTAYASTFGNVDLDGDIVQAGAFAKTIIEHDGAFPLLWQHDPWEPIGVTTSLVEDDHGLLMECDFNLDTQRGKEAHSLIRQKAMRGFSIGYRTVKYAWQGPVRILQELALREISAVTFPANTQAVLVDAKAAAAALDAIRARLGPEADTKTLDADELYLLDAALETLQALRSWQPGTEPTAICAAASDDAAEGGKSTTHEPAFDATRAVSLLRDTFAAATTTSRKD